MRKFTSKALHLIFVSAIIFIVLNILSYILLPYLPSSNRKLATYLSNDAEGFAKDLYTEMPAGYFEDVFTDVISYFQQGQSYFPHTEYCETPFRSKTLNIVTDPTGISYRSGFEPCFTQPDSSTTRIYVFGGSTSFGSFVADKESWPAQLNKILNEKGKPVEVVNYAVQGGCVTEEFLRFYDLVKLGHRPALVIVMDGVNLGGQADVSRYSNAIYNRIYEWQQSKIANAYVTRLFLNLPVMKALVALAPGKVLEYLYSMKYTEDNGTSPLESKNDPQLVRNYINRFNAGISDFQYLCNKHHIKFLYFLQPNAFYNYPRQSPEIENPDFSKDLDTIFTGVKLANPNQVLDLSNLFSKYGKKAIVDNCHYSVAFNTFVATEVAGYIKIDSLPPSYINSRAATGTRFTFFTTE